MLTCAYLYRAYVLMCGMARVRPTGCPPYLLTMASLLTVGQTCWLNAAIVCTHGSYNRRNVPPHTLQCLCVPTAALCPPVPERLHVWTIDVLAKGQGCCTQQPSPPQSCAPHPRWATPVAGPWGQGLGCPNAALCSNHSLLHQAYTCHKLGMSKCP